MSDLADSFLIFQNFQFVYIQELFGGIGMSVRIQNDIEIGPILQQQAAVGNTGLEEREDKPDNRA